MGQWGVEPKNTAGRHTHGTQQAAGSIDRAYVGSSHTNGGPESHSESFARGANQTNGWGVGVDVPSLRKSN